MPKNRQISGIVKDPHHFGAQSATTFSNYSRFVCLLIGGSRLQDTEYERQLQLLKKGAYLILALI